MVAWARIRIKTPFQLPSMLSVLNSDFESGRSDPPASVWNDWLWGSDLLEPVTVDCLLNRCHLLGLLVARFRAMREPRLMDLCVTIPNMTYVNSRVSTMTARQLQDTVQDLQVHWREYADTLDSCELLELVDALMTRFGYFNLHPSVYEDVAMRDSVHSDRMSVLCIRRFVTTFCVLYRHLDLMHRWAEPEETEAVEEIQEFHVQASMEAFYKHTMHADLPPASKTLYRQDFSGFYHCVSQAVYFHFPSYERRVQLGLADIRRGDRQVYTLAPLMEMYPEINLCYEDETPVQGKWNWYLACGRVYLLDDTGNVWFHANIFRMAGFYLARGKTIRA